MTPATYQLEWLRMQTVRLLVRCALLRISLDPRWHP
jgi:hypothetical protein